MILVYFLKAVFVLTCIFLILVVLLQSGKGGDVAAAFGGSGSQTAFGPRGAQKPLEKATVIAAILFMFLALVFSLPGFNGPSSVVRDSGGVTTQPSPAASPSAPAASPSAMPAAAPAASASPASPAASPASSPAKNQQQ
ncbi:MAG TPA: preprotein translocase subunit SecG [Blastocatellia bacterium]|nr:preprotein translocase subunit SecG [Blastocatellia bacterium]